MLTDDLLTEALATAFHRQVTAEGLAVDLPAGRSETLARTARQARCRSMTASLVTAAGVLGLVTAVVLTVPSGTRAPVAAGPAGPPQTPAATGTAARVAEATELRDVELAGSSVRVALPLGTAVNDSSCAPESLPASAVEGSPFAGAARCLVATAFCGLPISVPADAHPVTVGDLTFQVFQRRDGGLEAVLTLPGGRFNGGDGCPEILLQAGSRGLEEQQLLAVMAALIEKFPR